MATLTSTNHTLPTDRHLKMVHSQLEGKFKKNTKGKEKAAKEIEYYLNLIKRKNLNADPVWYRIKQLTAATMGIQESDLFQHFNVIGKNSGEDFETAIATMLQVMVENYLTIYKNSLNNIKPQTETFAMDVLTGSIYGNIKTKQGVGLADMVDINKFAQVAEEHQIYARNKDGTLNRDRYANLASVEAKQIKTDIRGKNLARITQDISWNTTNPFLRFLKLMTNYSFSLKNYNVNTKFWNTIHIGSSNTFRAYAGVLSDLGYSARVIENSFWRAYGCYNAKHGHGVKEHMGHIQSLYELIGMGIVFADEVRDQVDFLIINAKGADNIFVLDTSTLALEVLYDDSTHIGISSKRNVFGGGSVTLTGSSLGQLQKGGKNV